MHPGVTLGTSRQVERPAKIMETPCNGLASHPGSAVVWADLFEAQLALIDITTMTTLIFDRYILYHLILNHGPP